MRDVLRAGADKVSLNTAAVADPDLVTACARKFGGQAVVVAIDARMTMSGSWEVVVKGGREAAGLDAVDWAERVASIGRASSSSPRSTGTGPSPASTRAAAGDHVSGDRAGDRLRRCVRPADFVRAVVDGGADAVLAASVFHRRLHSIAEVKAAMAEAGLSVRRIAA